MHEPAKTAQLSHLGELAASGDPLHSTLPSRIGRYRTERILGQGGFGVVYLAHDDQLQRKVAIKVPHAKLVAKASDAEAYLIEARTVANLDHPHIVPVYDVGGTDEFPCYVVSKYIDGIDLSNRLKQSRLSQREAVELVATVAEALHYAHSRGLVHRDVTPGNILLDLTGKAFIGDFGLALREQDIGRGPRYVGTPAYMSPEQARGEGHRVDGRSDIFSLGVVLYELLAGRRPFKTESQLELLNQIASAEARPLRQIDDQIPKELERICLKALSKRAADRYTAATDFADDLRCFMASASVEPKSSWSGRLRQEAADAAQTPASTPQSTPQSNPRSTPQSTPQSTPHSPPPDSQFPRIMPKGLRSFEAHDADFFLELLPGPRDREGLPESIRFWKTRIETNDVDLAFSVGLIYGPSGCGKSSLVKAGLLPRLASSVTTIYIEATEDAEARLLKRLRRQFPGLPDGLGLIESLTALRQRRFLESGQKVLLVLDQFEQWLHAKGNEKNVELVQSLRQCDGVRLQCIVMVRDDFWMAATRFMRDLEVCLVEGENSAAVDLFPTRHAEKVLAAFGRAFGEMSQSPGDDRPQQRQFIENAVAGLAEEGKVIPVRLALFAEMVKGKPWTPATLKAVGGAAGVGVAFLEETFSASTAPPHHSLYQKAARAVLKALLPNAGANIKGAMRSREELLAASGYAGHPRDFDALLRLLDNELRLITPTEQARDEGPEARDGADEPAPSADIVAPVGSAPLNPVAPAADSAVRFYQLTHDYLISALRQWLHRKQKETRRGRAEILLDEVWATWNAKPDNSRLPTLWEYAKIRLFTRPSQWSEGQRRMLARAARRRGMQLAFGAAAIVAALLIGREVVGRARADALVDKLVSADIDQVPEIIGKLSGLRRWADPLLLKLDQVPAAETIPRTKLRVALALLPDDPGQLDYLEDRLLIAEPPEVLVICDALEPYRAGLVEKLWAVVESPEEGQQDSRLRAAAALAKFDANNESWRKLSVSVAQDLVRQDPVFLSYWSNAFWWVKSALLQPLGDIFRDRRPERAAQRYLATNLLIDYVVDQPKELTDLLLDADDEQFAVIYPKLKGRADQFTSLLTGAIDSEPEPNASNDAKERLAKRQANAAVTLLRMDEPNNTSPLSQKVWRLLAYNPDPSLRGYRDPTVRSYLIHRFAPLDADPTELLRRLTAPPSVDNPSEVSVLRGLILSLGEFSERQLPPPARKALLPKLQKMYETDADPGLHAAAEWLLRQWEMEKWLKEVNGRWANEQKRPEEVSREISDPGVAPPGGATGTIRHWYVNREGQTMVVFPGPAEFMMGSPTSEAGRSDNVDETLHKVRIGRTFALAAKPVTLEQYERYWKDYELVLPEIHRRSRDLPVVFVDWCMAAEYCNWLSAQAGLAKSQLCYEIAGTKDSEEVIKLKPNYLSLGGYRLPTEAEMEYATRAGTATSRYFGSAEDLLPKYSWYNRNSREVIWPVGLLKPNDWGLFDMEGNVWNWCQNTYKPYPESKEPSDDKEDELAIDDKLFLVYRGASFAARAPNIRSANRDSNHPKLRTGYFGFRVARTLPAIPLNLSPAPGATGRN